MTANLIVFKLYLNQMPSRMKGQTSGLQLNFNPVLHKKDNSHLQTSSVQIQIFIILYSYSLGAFRIYVENWSGF